MLTTVPRISRPAAFLTFARVMAWSLVALAACDDAVEATPDGAPPDATPATGDATAADADVPAYCQTIPEDATVTATLRITADNECEVFLNGTSVGTTTSWPSPVTLDVSLFAYPGKKNVIAVRATNTSSQAGPDRGILGELTITSGGDPAALVLTDTSWRVAASEQADWSTVDFDDTAWIPAAVVAAHGDAPWGSLLTTSGASWIWSAPVATSTADKPDVETAYARRTFYFAGDGTTVVDAATCP